MKYSVNLITQLLITVKMNSITVPSLRWSFNIDDWKPKQDEWVLASSCLQPEERLRVDSFVFVRDAKASLIGRLMIRKMLSETFSIPYKELTVSRTEKGKPTFQNVPETDFDFNISHNGSYCVLATEPAPKVGIDVMRIEYSGGKPLPDFFKLMKRQFAQSEFDYIVSPGLEIDQLKRFYRLWVRSMIFRLGEQVKSNITVWMTLKCLKESYVKAEGIGIGCTLRRLCFDCSKTPYNEVGKLTMDTTLSKDGKFLSSWLFEETLLDNNHVVSVALERRSSKMHFTSKESTSRFFEHLTFQQLVESAQPLTVLDLNSWRIFSKKCERPGC
ncbi:L-aminoadipate-semialdehyde dehydrogenase-phosphopantetheinyl transferase [Tachypleus tridentatus]|uniref:L-aminoadipate-semialdehyde dehydrogenase-phosphopantetheinyl transferase n=1 Tax=Tachypleus tridentatus TaxID=6853 RepID=UPI003FD0E45F